MENLNDNKNYITMEKNIDPYIVVDIVLDEPVFSGTYKGCMEWKNNKGFGYVIKPNDKHIKESKDTSDKN